MEDHFKRASKIIEGWPSWKKDIYRTVKVAHRPKAIESNESPSDSGSRPSELSAYGNDCPSGNCEV